MFDLILSSEHESQSLVISNKPLIGPFLSLPVHSGSVSPSLWPTPRWQTSPSLQWSRCTRRPGEAASARATPGSGSTTSASWYRDRERFIPLLIRSIRYLWFWAKWHWPDMFMLDFSFCECSSVACCCFCRCWEGYPGRCISRGSCLPPRPRTPRSSPS